MKDKWPEPELYKSDSSEAEIEPVDVYFANHGSEAPKKSSRERLLKKFQKASKITAQKYPPEIKPEKKQELEKFEKTVVTEKEEEFEKHEESEKHEEFEKHAEFEEKQEIKDLLPPDEEMTEKENLEPELSERLSPIEVVKDSLDTTEIHEVQ